MDKLVGVLELKVLLGQESDFSQDQTLEFINLSFTFAQGLGTGTPSSEIVDFLLQLKNRLYGIFGEDGEYKKYEFDEKQKTSMKDQAIAFLSIMRNNLKVGLKDERESIIKNATGGKRIRRRRGRRTAKKTNRKPSRKTIRRRARTYKK